MGAIVTLLPLNVLIAGTSAIVSAFDTVHSKRPVCPLLSRAGLATKLLIAVVLFGIAGEAGAGAGVDIGVDAGAPARL